MTYLDAIAYVLRRMSEKHREKGLSFSHMNNERLDELIHEEYAEWVSSEDIKNEFEELADLAITCMLKIQAMMDRRD